MEISPLFQKIWRFNAVIIALAGLLAVFLLLLGSGLIAYEIYSDLTRQQRDQVITTDNQDQKPIQESLSLGTMDEVNGHPVLYFPLHGEQSVSRGFASYSKGDTRSIRNYLFFDLKSNSSHWLLPNHDTLILEDTHYPYSYGDNPPPVRAIVFEIVYNDSDHNNRLNREDKVTLALSTPEGEKLTNVIEGVDQITGQQLFDDTTLIVTYTMGEKSLLSRIDLKTFTIQSTQELDLAIQPAKASPQSSGS